MTIDELARAFVNGETKGQCHNARILKRSHGTDVLTHYVLHNSSIAVRYPDGSITGDWCRFHTAATASHLNAIRAAAGTPGERASYAKARDGKSPEVFKIR